MTVEEDLRAAFVAVTADVTIRADPMGRLMRRRRNRSVTTAAAGLAMVLALVLVAGPAMRGLVSRYDANNAASLSTGYPIASPWTQRLLDSPTRGSLAGQEPYLTSLRRDLERGRTASRVNPSLNQLTLLFVGDVGTARMAIVVWHSTTEAAQFTYVAQPGAGPDLLAQAQFEANGVLRPLIVMAVGAVFPNKVEASFRLGLVPAGCSLATSTDGRVERDGTIRRSWTGGPHPDYIVSDGGQATQRWRVTCDGVVRYEGTGTDPSLAGESTARPESTKALDGARGPLDRRTALLAANLLGDMSRSAGLRVAEPTVVWGGVVPDVEAPVSVVAARSGDGGAITLLGVGDVRQSVVGVGVDAAAESDDPLRDGSQQQRGLVSTGTAGSLDLFAVRLPQRTGTRAVWSDRLLVVAPTSTVRVRALDEHERILAEGHLTEGVGTLTVKAPSTAVLQAYDSTGTVVATTRMAERVGPPVLFGEPIVQAW
jgi:hypothetical protein